MPVTPAAEKVRLRASIGEKAKARYNGELEELCDSIDKVLTELTVLKLAAKETLHSKGAQLNIQVMSKVRRGMTHIEAKIGSITFCHSLGVHSGFGHRAPTTPHFADDVLEKIPPRHRLRMSQGKDGTRKYSIG